jgi:L-fuconolactonase
MVTEADWKNWKDEDIIPYIDTVVNAFGPHRIVFGSDWPVCLVAASYDRTVRIVRDYFARFTEDEQLLFFGGNAARFYNIE